MGIIISGIQLITPQFNKILGMMPKVNTDDLETQMLKTVYKSFRALKPLCYNYHEIKEITYQHRGSYTQTSTLCMGEWIRLKSGSYGTYGSVVDDYKTFWYVMKPHGHLLKGHTRQPIKNDFSDLIDMLGRLKDYTTVGVSHRIPETKVYEYDIPRAYKDSSGKEIKEKTFNVSTLSFHSSMPSEVRLHDKDEKNYVRRTLTDDANVSVFEDIIDHVADLYAKAYNEIGKVRLWNEAILKAITDIADTWRIAASLKA